MSQFWSSGLTTVVFPGVEVAAPGVCGDPTCAAVEKGEATDKFEDAVEILPRRFAGAGSKQS